MRFAVAMASVFEDAVSLANLPQCPVYGFLYKVAAIVMLRAQ
jgi:hypothetical protein